MCEIISSRQNRTIIKICKLTDKKNRDAEQVFRFDGIKLYCEAAAAGVELVYILLREVDCEAVVSKITACGAPAPRDTGATVLCLTDSLFSSVSNEKSPEGIICVAKYIDKFHKIATINNSLVTGDINIPVPAKKIIMLENIQDPGNLGTIMRCAAAFNFESVMLVGECADIYHPRALRAAMGATFKLKTLVCRDGVELVRLLREGGRRILAAMPCEEAAKLGTLGLRQSDCIAIGNEGNGLSRELSCACDASIVIPMYKGNESLNAASAAAIFMWEVARVPID